LPVNWAARTSNFRHEFLRIALKKEDRGKLHYTAGGVISKKTFKYGYYEARFRVPPGAGWHTSFWMMRNGR
jgi:beta-glucanase (GH16 family)